MKPFPTRSDLSKSDLRGLFIIFIALLAVAGIRYGLRFLPLSDALPPVSEAERRMLDSLAAQARADSSRREERGRDERPAYGISKERLFPFDPNAADSATLVRLGLRPWQASNAMKYRRRGGRWRTPDDFARLYGLSREDFLLLRPYIRIAEPQRAQAATDAATARRDSFASRNPEKFPEGTVVDLNRADTTVLKRIPGIGSYYAARICRYREQLGGFVSVAQVRELDGLPADVERWFTVDAQPQVRQMNLNAATFRQLVRHPYLSYEQVKAIADHIRKYGPLKGWDDLRLYGEFTPQDFRRLQPYFCFK